MICGDKAERETHKSRRDLCVSLSALSPQIMMISNDPNFLAPKPPRGYQARAASFLLQEGR
jgi:hypothetical protein